MQLPRQDSRPSLLISAAMASPPSPQSQRKPPGRTLLLISLPSSIFSPSPRYLSGLSNKASRIVCTSISRSRLSLWLFLLATGFFSAHFSIELVDQQWIQINDDWRCSFWKVFIVAKNFGARTAYDFALQHPNRVHGVVTLGMPFVSSQGMSYSTLPEGFYILRWRVMP